MKEMKIEEWRTLGTKLYGEDVHNWEFRCPMCDKISKVSDFEKYADKGAKPASAYQECIGRYEGKGSPKKKDGSGCNWAAYGLFGIPGEDKIILKEDDGSTIMAIFPFSKEE